MYNTILKVFVSGIYRLNMIKNLKFVSLHPIFEMVHKGRVKNFNNPMSLSSDFTETKFHLMFFMVHPYYCII